MKLPIRIYPDPVLKQVAPPVKEVNDITRGIMDSMVETMHYAGGFSLTAPQVNYLRRIIVIDLRNEDDKTKENGLYPLFMVNPEIVVVSTKCIVRSEKCLSVPSHLVNVPRSTEITIKYTDYNGNIMGLEANDELAGVIQHGIDHLDGKLLGESPDQ